MESVDNERDKARFKDDIEILNKSIARWNKEKTDIARQEFEKLAKEKGSFYLGRYNNPSYGMYDYMNSQVQDMWIGFCMAKNVNPNL